MISTHLALQSREWDVNTAYEAMWIVDCIREFMYDNRGGLDGLSFLWLRNNQKISKPMLALFFTAVCFNSSR